MMRLRSRLLVTHLLVAVMGAAASVVVVVWQAPQVFDRGIGGQGMYQGANQGQGPGSGPASGPGSGPGQELSAAGIHTAFLDALRQALLVGSLVALLVAVVAAWFVAIRLARPLEEVRQVTRRISEGDYDQRIAVPRETELAALVEDVNGLAQRLGEVESERVRLLGEVAHEMRTPLTVLTGRVEGLQDGVFSADVELLAGLRAELQRLQRLADDLRTLSRVEERRLVLELEPVDLAGLARRSVDRFATGQAAEGVSMSVFAPDPVVVQGDAQRLGQVLDNLLSNALRAVRGKGAVEVRVERAHHSAIVTVTDDGAGISSSELGRIFERFYRSADARPQEGTGVGLTVSRGIAEAHGGTLAAESEGPGRGARLILTIPSVQLP